MVAWLIGSLLGIAATVFVIGIRLSLTRVPEAEASPSRHIREAEAVAAQCWNTREVQE
jgi:hypothetical protein